MRLMRVGFLYVESFGAEAVVEVGGEDHVECEPGGAYPVPITG